MRRAAQHHQPAAPAVSGPANSRPRDPGWWPAVPRLGHEFGSLRVHAGTQAQQRERDAARGVLPPAGPARPPSPLPPSGVLAELGTGEPLPGPERARWERATAADLSPVRLHRGPRAAAAAAGLGARALTVGEHIAFGAGRYAPGTGAGDRLLRHELTHVLQQRWAGAVGVQLAPVEDPLELLPEEPIPVPEKTRAPSGWAKVTDPSGQSFLVRARIFDLRDLPDTPEINRLEFAGKGTEKETIAQMRSRDLKAGKEVRVMLGRRAGRLVLLGADTWQPADRWVDIVRSGGVASAAESRGVGRMLFANRIKETLRAGTELMSVTVGTYAGERNVHTEKFHQNIRDIAGIAGQPDTYKLNVEQMVRVLKAFEPEAGPQPRGGKPPGTPPAPPAGPPPPPPAPGAPPAAPPQATTMPGRAAPPSSPAVTPAGPRPKPPTTGGGRALLVGSLLAGVTAWLKDRFDKQQQELVEATLAQHQPGIAAHVEQQPAHGALIRVAFREPHHAESLLPALARFSHLEIGYGRTREEALSDLANTAVAYTGLGQREQWQFQDFWQEPRVSSAPAELRPPFPKRMLAAARARALALQDVKWDLDGFDDEGTSTVSVGPAESLSFFVLAVPPRIGMHTIPVENVSVTGGTVPSVNLDPANPFNVHAVAVFPANEATLSAFEQSRSTELRVPFPVRPNFSLVRWVRPEHLILVPTPETR